MYVCKAGQKEDGQGTPTWWEFSSIQAEGGKIPLPHGLKLMFWRCYLTCDTNFEFGEKIYLVFLNNTLSLLPANKSYISQDISSSSAPTYNTCNNKKLVSYIVIHTRCVCMWGMGESKEGVRRGQAFQKADWLSTESISNLGVLSPRAKCQKPESIFRHCFPFSCSWWLKKNKAFE